MADTIHNQEEMLGSEPPQTEHLTDNDPHSGPADYSTETAEPNQADIQAGAAVQEIPETSVPDDLETFGQPWYKTKVAKIGASVAGALVVVGSILSIPGPGDSDTEVRLNPATGYDPATQPAKTEALSEEGEMAFMTSDNPEKVLKQFQINESCMINSEDAAKQEMCARYISDPTRTSTQYHELLGTIELYNSISKREYLPEHRFNRDYELLDSTTADNIMTMIVHVVATDEKISGGVHREEEYLRLRFIKIPIVIEDLTADGDTREVWFLESQSPVDPGSVRS